MTNKPMLSVELRAFLEGVVKLCSVHGPTYNELRALLDKEVDGNSHAPEKHGEPVAEVERVEGDLPHVQLYQDLPDGTKLYAEQLAPVAGSSSDTQDMLHSCAYRNGVMFGYGIGINGTEADYQKCINRLQEQIVDARRELKKSPVADRPQCEECKGWGYHENHHEGGGTECGECGGSGKAPVSVVIPDREGFDIDDWAGSFCQEALSFGVGQDVFARCVRTTIDRTLAEVARLNGVKP